jgi:hypothetical protein
MISFFKRQRNPPISHCMSCCLKKAYCSIYWPSAMDVPMKLKTTAPSVGFSALIKKSYGNAQASHEGTQCNITARKGMVASPYSRFLHITSSTWKCKHLTTYRMHHFLLRQLYSLPKNEETFHTRDINSSSWYTNPDHEVIMT